MIEATLKRNPLVEELKEIKNVSQLRLEQWTKIVNAQKELNEEDIVVKSIGELQDCKEPGNLVVCSCSDHQFDNFRNFRFEIRATHHPKSKRCS